MLLPVAELVVCSVCIVQLYKTIKVPDHVGILSLGIILGSNDLYYLDSDLIDIFTANGEIVITKHLILRYCINYRKLKRQKEIKKN